MRQQERKSRQSSSRSANAVPTNYKTILKDTGYMPLHRLQQSILHHIGLKDLSVHSNCSDDRQDKMYN